MKPLPNADLSAIDAVFPASVSHLMPEPGDIPSDYPRRRDWEAFQAKWFFEGLQVASVKPKDGIDLSRALLHLQCIQSSFEPSHEHKQAAVAWLSSQWLDESCLDSALRKVAR